MNLNNVKMQSGEGSLNIKCDKTDCMQITGNYNINNFGSLKPSNYDVSIWIPHKKIKIITNGNLQIQPKQTNGLNELNWRLYSNFDGVETKFDINGNCNENHGAINFNLILHDRKPVRTDFSYTLISGTSLKYGNIISDLIFRPKQLNTIFNINYEEQKFIKIEANYEHHTDFIHDLTINIMTSFDDYKKMNLQILTKVILFSLAYAIMLQIVVVKTINCIIFFTPFFLICFTNCITHNVLLMLYQNTLWHICSVNRTKTFVTFI